MIYDKEKLEIKLKKMFIENLIYNQRSDNKFVGDVNIHLDDKILMVSRLPRRLEQSKELYFTLIREIGMSIYWIEIIFWYPSVFNWFFVSVEKAPGKTKKNTIHF